MSDIKLDLLRTDQIYGPNRLKIFDQIGIVGDLTDFAIVTGADVYKKNNHPTGWYWTKTDNGYGYVDVVNPDGYLNFADIWRHSGCIRPVVKYSKIRDICQNKRIGKYGEVIVDCGIFPKESLSKELEEDLDKKFKLGLLEKVDLVTTDVGECKDINTSFSKIDQYIYKDNEDNKLYTRVKANVDEDEFSLSNGKTYKNKSYIWLNEFMVEWIVDKKNNIAIARNQILSGIKFDSKKTYKGNFKTTNLYQYMNTYLNDVIFSSYISMINEQNASQKVYKK